MNQELLFQEVYALVERIPYGKVMSYGQIASYIGFSRNARMVGKAMRYAEFFGSFPCHRVVSSQGLPSRLFAEQRQLLEAESVRFTKGGHVLMKQYTWHPE